MIDLQLHDRVYVLRMQDGENRFNAHSLDAWQAALDRIEQSATDCALVTVGDGKFYSNGLDLAWMGGVAREVAADNVQRVHELLARLLTLPLITVAAVNGHAFAAGAMLVLAHDLRVMRADRGFFCLPEVDLKMTFTPAMQALINARLPNTVAHEAMITGKRYGGELAAARGIVDEALPEAELLPRAIALAQSLTGKQREVLGAIKRANYAHVLEQVAAEAKRLRPG